MTITEILKAIETMPLTREEAIAVSRIAASRNAELWRAMSQEERLAEDAEELEARVNAILDRAELATVA
jgi:hypothetical protein